MIQQATWLITKDGLKWLKQASRIPERIPELAKFVSSDILRTQLLLLSAEHLKCTCTVYNMYIYIHDYTWMAFFWQQKAARLKKIRRHMDASTFLRSIWIHRDGIVNQTTDETSAIDCWHPWCTKRTGCNGNSTQNSSRNRSRNRSSEDRFPARSRSSAPRRPSGTVSQWWKIRCGRFVGFCWTPIMHIIYADFLKCGKRIQNCW